MRFSIFIIATLLIGSISSCRYFGGERIRGNGNVTNRNMPVSSFSDVRASGALTVYLSQGSTHAVQVETDDNLYEFLEVYVDGAQLVVSTKEGYNLMPSKDLIIHVTSPTFRNIDVSGAVDIISKNTITSSSAVAVNISGSGELRMDVNAPKVTSTISGSGSMLLNGNTGDFNAEISGSGEIRSFGLIAEQAHVQLSGSADAQVTASKLLNISISGSGHVQYKGNPSVKQNISGSGSVEKVS